MAGSKQNMRVWIVSAIYGGLPVWSDGTPNAQRSPAGATEISRAPIATSQQVSDSGHAVNTFTDQISMPAVAGIFRDHVGVDPAQTHPAVHELAGVIEPTLSAIGACMPDLVLPDLSGGPVRRGPRHLETPVVPLGMISWPENRWRRITGKHPAKPIPLHLRRVPHQPQQRQSRRRHRGKPQLLVIKTLALQRQRRPIESSQPSSVVRSSAFIGGIGRSIEVTLIDAATPPRHHRAEATGGGCATY